MLKHLLLYSIITDFIGALGVLNFPRDTLRVLLFAVTPERLAFFIYTLRVRVGYILIVTLLIICYIVFMYLGMSAAQTAG